MTPEDSQHGSTHESSPHERLYFAYTRTAPPLDQFDVKRVVSADLLGTPATLTIIGASHYIGSQQLGFHELCSCTPLDSESMYRVPLTRTVDRSFTFENDRLSASTTVETRPLSDRPDEQTADVAYRFGPDAWTILTVTADAYETYHTYPEYELTLYTRTRLTAITSAESRGSGPGRADSNGMGND